MVKKYLTGICLAAWMAVIFLFSAQTAEDSAQVSQTVGYRIASWQNRVFHQGKTEEELLAQAESLQFFVRKGAHMCEYAVLAALALLHLSCYPFSGGKAAALAFALTACYAATDEFHQIFVPGRAGQVTDVCVDSAGGLLGIAFLYACGACVRAARGKAGKRRAAKK